MPLGRPVVVLGEGMGSYWRDLGGVWVLGWFVWVMVLGGWGEDWEWRGTYRSQYCV